MVYIIKSETYRLLDKKLKELTRDIDKDNISYFDLNIDKLKDILEECNYTSLFNDKKVVIVNNVNLFGTKYEYKEDMEILEHYLDNMNKNTILIFLVDSYSKTKKCVKRIIDNGGLIEILKPNGDNLKEEIKNYLKEYGYKIENKALDELINNNLSNFDYSLNELDKVMVIKKDYLINISDIEKYTTKIKEDNIFDFVDVVIKKDIKNVYKKLDEYIKNKEEPAILISNIASQYRLIYSVKNLIKEGYSEKNIADELKIHPYRIKLAYQNSYNYSNEELVNKLLKIGELDEKIKKGLIDKYVALKLLLVDL